MKNKTLKEKRIKTLNKEDKKIKYVKVRMEDLLWILIMPSWEFTTKAIKKSEEVNDRLWEVIGVKDKITRMGVSAKIRMTNDNK